MTLATSDSQSRRWTRRLRDNAAAADQSSAEHGSNQLSSSGQSRRWSYVNHMEAEPFDISQASLPQSPDDANEEQGHVHEQQDAARQVEPKVRHRRQQRGPMKQQSFDNALAFRAAHDAQASVERAGMMAKVETRNSGGVQTSVLGGEAFYLPEWFCQDQDRSLYQLLRRELHGHITPFRGKSLGLAGTQAILEECPTYKDIVTRLARYFEVEACYSIVNFYQDGSHGIGAHTDSLFFGTDMTIGASFGDPRELLFEHKRTQQRFEFPQRNGDVFAFTDVANRTFRHSVPKTKDKVGGRLSIIVWARQGGFKPVCLQSVVMPSEQDLREAGGDWNRAQQLAVTKLTSGDWKRAQNESGA